MNIPFLFIGTMELVVILAVVLLLFGARKIPELMYGIGKGMKSFKEGMNGGDEPKTENKQEQVSEQKPAEQKPEK